MNDCDRDNEDRIVITNWNDTEEKSCHQGSTTASALKITS